MKGMLTIALIPPILKYVFGIEKNMPANSQSALVQNNNAEAVKSEYATFSKAAMAKFLGGEQ